ncbi:LruC domain-containing protein [Bacteroides bouchesdurhonensis]
MRRFNLFAPIIAIAIVSALFSCVDSDKNFYDSSYRTPNPMGDEFVAPDGFDWSMTATTQVTVEVNDQFNGQFYYTVELYDNHPVISADAHLLGKGVAKGDKPYVINITAEKTINTIYVKEITPTGFSTVKSADITDGIAICSFKTTTSAIHRSLATTRGLTIEEPNDEDPSLFPIKCPTENIFGNGNSIKDGESYKVTSTTKNIELKNNKNIKLYITEDINLENPLILSTGSSLFILPGIKVSATYQNNGQKNSFISIGKNASLIFNGDIKLDQDFKIYNMGNISADTWMNTNSSFFYNGSEGIATISGKISGENMESFILNAGTLKAKTAYISGNSHIMNRGKMDIEEKTVIDCNNGIWENEGKWFTYDFLISSQNQNAINKCKLVVTNEFQVSSAKLINDGGAYIQCKELYMDDATIELGVNSLLEVTEKAEFGYNVNNKGFKGTSSNTNKALLVMKKAIAKYPNNNDMIHYTGNIQIVCSDHPNALVDAWNKRWTMTNGAEWGEEGKNTLSIPQTECNNGYGGGISTDPKDPQFPIEVEDNHEYSYLFEDQWPLYGDYDMNDIVMTIKKRKLKLSKHDNKVEEFELEIELSAVGATKKIGAAIMFDGVLASDITEEVDFDDDDDDNTLIKNFNLNNYNIEKGQKYAVVPLFDDAHKALGRDRYIQINTISGHSNNVKKTKTISFSIEFDKPTLSADAFNINKLNVFIITGGNGTNRREIHVAGYQPTQLADVSSFGGNDDASSISSKKYYLSKENLAWGIIVPTNFKWPLEYVNIKTAYNQFNDWVTSGGAGNKNWWNDWDKTKVFQTNKN